MYWFQMYHDNEHVEGFANNEIGCALFEHLRFEMGYFESAFTMRKLGIHYENNKFFWMFALDTGILNARYFSDDSSFYDDNDKVIPARDRIINIDVLGKIAFTIRLDTYPIYIYHFPHKNEKLNLINRLNLIINPSHLDGYEEYFDDAGREIKRYAWEL